MSSKKLAALAKSHFKDNIAFPQTELWFMFMYSPYIDCHQLHISKAILDEPSTGIGLQKNSEYLEVVEYAANGIIGSGHMNKILKYNIYALKAEETCESQQLPLIEYSSVRSIFNTLICFIVLSLLVAIAEYFWVMKKGM